jgi:hypothetical protein
MTENRRDALGIAALTAAALALRLAFRIDYDEDIDALRFALGVERFDVADLRPHAPYYPVVIAAAKVIAALGASPRGALAILSAIAGALIVPATALLARAIARGGDRQKRLTGHLAGALAVVSPFLWLSSEKLLSDMPGAALTTWALWLCARANRLEDSGDPARARARRTAALLLLGLGLGVRLSYFPVAIACWFCIARREGSLRAAVARGRDLAVGVLVWLVPLVATVPARELVGTTLVQGAGHFTRWGGTAITVSSPLDRLHGALWGLWANVLGGAWPDAPAARWIAAPALILFLGLALRRAAIGGLSTIRAQPELWASAFAYFVWALLGQNTVYKPRHWLPLAPLLVIAVASGASSLILHAQDHWRNRARLWSALPVAVLLVQWLADGASLARAHVAPSPAAALVAFLARSHGEGGDPGSPQRAVITADLARMIAEGAPATRVVRAPTLAHVAPLVLAEAERGALITTEALTPEARAELARRGYRLRVVFAAPRSRYVDSLWTELALVEASLSPSP